MWTDNQLDNADYVAFHDAETKQPLNVGTVEVQNSAYQGPYICTPMPPFGSVKNGDGTAGLGQAVQVPAKRFTVQFQSHGFPAPTRDTTVLHQYGKGNV